MAKNNFWKGKKVLVTGGGGFLGKVVIRKLKEKGVSDENIIDPRSKDYDLTEQSDVRKLFKKFKPNIVLHIAGQTGGIQDNRDNPGRYFYNNLMIGSLTIEEARRAGVEKLVAVGSVCSYPKFAPIPFKEEDLWNGYPEETNAPYGLAKKMMLVQSQAYRQQYGFNSNHLLMINLYGPGDHFDPVRSHVIPALIMKFMKAKESGEKEVVAWGTGKASREFLYVDDAAEAIILAAERYDSSEPVNIGASFEITIKDLTELIARLIGYKGKVVWDTTKPDGQPRRKLDTSKAKKEFGFKSKVSFEEGLRKTITWYKKNLAPSESK